MRAIETGTEVIHAEHSGTYLYGGPDDHGGGWCAIRVTIGRPGSATITCEPAQVAPADAAHPNPADTRYRIEKLRRKRHPWDPGPWLAHVEGLTNPDSPAAFKTKRDATAYAIRRLAIADYHAAQQGRD